MDGFSEADADELPVEPMDLDFEAWGDEDSTLDLGDEDPGDLGDAEMDDIDQDDSSEWGLTDGESESMSSSECDHGATGQDEESVRALVTLSVSIHEDEDANDVDDESLNLTNNPLASEEPK